MRVLITGVCGRMGALVAKTVDQAPDMAIAGGVDPAGQGRRLSECVPGLEGTEDTTVAASLEKALAAGRPDVMVDFTAPAAVMGNLRTALAAGVASVIGTTGLSESDLAEVRGLCEQTDTPAVIAPNFSLGAVLMMKFATVAATLFDYGEIIEFHHETKKDSPSGTALKTAEMMAEARGRQFAQPPTELQRVEGCRGGVGPGGIHIHAVRMQGFVADQQVLLGGPGETLAISHRTTSRECFMPGVLLAVRKVGEQTGLVYGLEHLLGL